MEHIRIKLWPSKGNACPLVGGWLKPCLVVLLVWAVLGTAAKAGSDADAGEGAKLKRQVGVLSEALVAAKIEIDGLKSRVENKMAVSEASATVKKKEYLILDVNKELGMVILNGGHRDGVKPGLMFDVIKGDKSVAMVRVVDARADVAGAVIQDADRELPRVHDRAVVAARLKN